MKKIISFDFDGVCNTMLSIVINNIDLNNVSPIIISSRDNTDDNMKDVMEQVKIINDINDIHLCGGFFNKCKKIKEINPYVHLDDCERVVRFIIQNTDVKCCLIKIY